MQVNDKTADFHALSRLLPPRAEASTITVACQAADFSASALARAVEDSNAHLVNLNVTADSLPGGRLVIELRTSLPHSAATVRSLTRYGFEVLSATSVPVTTDEFNPDDDALRRRAAELLHILQL